MPQGKIISITPIGFTEDKEYTEEEMLLNGCEGTVEILDGDYKGQTGYFVDAKKKCCHKKKGDKVEIKILGVDKDERVLVEINC